MRGDMPLGHVPRQPLERGLWPRPKVQERGADGIDKRE
jgi:hypothetical protein